MFLCYYCVLSFFIINAVQCYALTVNQIKEDIKFLSQTSDGIKPSRLRALLLADLKRALPIQPETNCSADADLKVTPNCTCVNYSCARSINHGKRSRIQRSCEDYCCRRSALVKKSLSDHEYYRSKFNGCEISNPETPESFKLSWMAQIFTTKSKIPICVGTLIHPKIVMTTLVCASMQMNEHLQIKIRETVDKYQYRYQIRNVTKKIIPDNYPELFEKFGFNIALLVLNKDIELNSDIRTMCLSQAPYVTRSNQKCFVDSLENKNGRILEKRESVVIRNADQCMKRYKEQNRQLMFFPKSNICAGKSDEQDIEITSNGASLVCFEETRNGYRYVQVGILSWSTAINKSPHLFANVSNFRNWIDKNLKDLRFV